MDVWADVALGSDLRAALEDGEPLDHRVLADDDAGVDERAVRVDDGDAAQHQVVEQPPAQDFGRRREPDPVFDAHRLARIVQRHHGDRLEVQEDVGEVLLARIVVVTRRAGLFDQLAAVEAVTSDVELMYTDAHLRRGVLALDDALQGAISGAYDAAVVTRRIDDAGDGRRRLLLNVRVDDPPDAGCCQQRRVAVDDKDLASPQLAGGDLPKRVSGSLRIAIVNNFYPTVDMGGDVGVMRIGDHIDVFRSAHLHRRSLSIATTPPPAQ